MNRRPILLTPVDLALLSQLGRTASLVEACRGLGITRDRGTYRLRRLARLAGGPVVDAQKGGRFHGSTRLTERGAALLRRGSDAVAVDAGATARDRGVRPMALEGVWHQRPQPNVVVEGLRLFVGFRADESERVRVELDPESVIVATRRFPTSARNVVPGVVRSVRRRGPGTGPVSDRVQVDVGGPLVEATVTERSVDRLGLVRGRRVFLYVKATALRRVPRGPAPPPTRGSRPS